MKTKINLNFDAYRDKVNACWVGKNIGGTMGTPYERTHEILDVKGFITEPNVVLPNDDLDLQLVWLAAVERFGAKAINSNLLAEFWVGLIPPHWNEYGLAKANMKRGIMPPLSGDYDNEWKHSNGAWIRTEIWASLAPAAPGIAAKYAIEDGMVDHGMGEGTYAAAFVAAMQSAAFVVSDLNKAIEIGLNAIPADCRIAKTIALVYECYNNGVPPMEAREKIRLSNADIGDGWFEAPSNVGYTVLGLLYGEGDFKKSMILAINCGDDTDCTAGTVGATLGLLGGMDIIPKDWMAHIGDSIVTMSIDIGTLHGLPKTCTALTDRVVRLAPVVLFENGLSTTISEKEDEIPEDIVDVFLKDKKAINRLKQIKPYSCYVESPFMTATATFDGDPEIAPMCEKKLSIVFKMNPKTLGNMPRTLTLRWLGTEGFTVEGKTCVIMPHKDSHHPDHEVKVDVTIHAGETVQPINRLVLEINDLVGGMPTYLPITLIG